jgi:sulfotransferase family protein
MSSQPGALPGSRMVFVGGLHRSGTTPLSRVLAAHPSVSGLHDTGVTEDEGQHLQSVYPPARVYGGPGRFALSPAAHLTEESPLATPEAAAGLSKAWLPYWDPARDLLLEKSPPNLIMGRFLQSVFPGSAMIVVMRHPVIVGLSNVKWRRLVARRWWLRTSLHDLVRHWFVAHELFREDAGHLKRLHVLKYEDLIAEPDRELEAIQRFLGLDQPFATDLLRTSHSQRYEQTWDEMSNKLVASRVRRRIEREFGDRAAKFGYDISDPRVRTPWSLTV